MKGVLDALEDLGSATTEAITEHPEVGIETRQVQKHLNTLRHRGVLDLEQHTEDGRKVVWHDDGIHRVNDHGEVDLEPVALEDLNAAEVDELARTSTYTWEFANLGGDRDGSGEQLGNPSGNTVEERSNPGDPASIEGD
jgi:hypothetical protein